MIQWCAMSMIQYDDLLRSILIIFLWYSYDMILSSYSSSIFVFSRRPDVYTVYSDDVSGRGLGRWVPMHARLSCWRIAFSCRTSWLNPKSILINTSQVFEHVFFDFVIICGILWLLRCFPSGCWLPRFCLVPVAWYFNIVESIESLFAKAKGLSEDWVVKSGAVERSWMWQMLYDVVLCRKRTLRLRPCNVCNVVVQSRHMQIIFHRQSDKQVRNVLYASRVQRWVMVSSC